MIDAIISVRVNATEDRDKVLTAIHAVFPELELSYQSFDTSEINGVLEGKTNLQGLINLHLLLRKEKIIDTARTQFEKNINIDQSSTSFIISKFVAFIGRLNFPAEEEPLGSIHVTLKSSSLYELNRLIEWLTPPTEKGKILYELDIDAVEKL